MEGQEYGFIAFWKATDSWFMSNEEERSRFMSDLKQVVDRARDKGIYTFGNFDCSWSSQWRYFTFWLCPSIELLQETMKELTQIGDINHFNIQHHYVGRKVSDEFVQ